MLIKESKYYVDKVGARTVLLSQHHFSLFVGLQQLWSNGEIRYI